MSYATVLSTTDMAHREPPTDTAEVLTLAAFTADTSVSTPEIVRPLKGTFYAITRLWLLAGHPVCPDQESEDQ
jgi:hypothetical protein